MSTFMGGNHPTYMYMGPSYDEEYGALGQHPNQQTYGGLYDSYVPTLVTGDLISGLPPNGVVTAAHLAPTPDTCYARPPTYYGFDSHGNICYWPIPQAHPTGYQPLQPSLLAPTPVFDNPPPSQPVFGYGPIIGGGVPPAAFSLHHPQSQTRASSVHSTAFSTSIWSQAELQPSPSLSFTASDAGSTTCSPAEQDEEMAYWSGTRYFAYPRFDQTESDAWNSQQYIGPIATSAQSFPWSVQQPAAPTLLPAPVLIDRFTAAAPIETQQPIPRNPTPITTPPTKPVPNTSTLDSKPTSRPARRPRAAPATFKIKKNIINPKAKVPEPWELEVVALKEKHTYEQIRRIIAAKYGVHKAISTIRGVKRNVVLPPHLRPRKAEWGGEHLTALRTGFPKYATFNPDRTIKSVAWLKLCKYIEQQTGFPFGPTATHRVYNEKLHAEDPERFPFVGVVGKGKGKGKGKGREKQELEMAVEEDESDKKANWRTQYAGKKGLRRAGWMYGNEEQQQPEQEEDEEEEQDEEEDDDETEEEL